MWPQSTSNSHQHITLTLCETGPSPILVYQLGTGNLRGHTKFVTQYPPRSYLPVTS